MPDLTPAAERELAAIDDALAGRRVAPDLTELGELALLLRDERPAPDPGFTARLDESAGRGFRDADPRSRTSGTRTRRPLAWLLMPGMGAALAGVLVIVVLAGGNGDGGREAATSASGGGSDAAGEAAQSTPGRGSDAAGEAAQGAPAPATGTLDAAGRAQSARSVPPVAPPATGSPGSDARTTRKVERSAAVTLAAPAREIDAVSARVQAVARQHDGFVGSASVSSTDGGSFTLRIPTRNLDAAVAALSRLGAVRERSQTQEDITAASVSAADRLQDARAERTALLRQLERAATPDEATRIRRRLRSVSNEIAAAKRAVRRVENRAAFATVAVTLVVDDRAEGAAEETDGGWSLGDAARDAGRVLEVGAGVLLLALVIGLPLLALALLAAAGARWAARRRRERVLDAI